MTKTQDSKRAAPRARKKARAPEAPKSADEAQSGSGPSVAPEERHRLAECCAFFKAEHYREAEPGHIRKQDIEAAEAEIDAVLKSSGKT